MQARKLSKTEKRDNHVTWRVGESRVFPLEFNFSAFMALGWFVGIFLLYWMYQYTDITFTDTIKWFVLFSVILTVIPYKWVLKFLTIEYSQLIALNIIGFGPLFTGLFLTLNMVLADEPIVTTYAIKTTGISSQPFENHFVMIILEENALQEQPRFRRFDQVYLQDFYGCDSISYTISNGLFGYDVLVGYELVSGY